MGITPSQWCSAYTFQGVNPIVIVFLKVKKRGRELFGGFTKSFNVTSSTSHTLYRAFSLRGYFSWSCSLKSCCVSTNRFSNQSLIIVNMNTGRFGVSSARIHRVRNARGTGANIIPISPLTYYVLQSFRMRGGLTPTSRYTSIALQRFPKAHKRF